MHQFEPIGGNLTCVLQVGTATQVLPFAVPIHANGFVAGDRFNQFNLKGFVCVRVMLDCAITFPYLGAYAVPQVDDVLHLFFNQTQILWGKGLFTIKIIIPSIVNDRANGDFDIGPNFLDRTRHNMRQIVTHQFQCGLCVFYGVDGNCRICINGPLQIIVRTVHSCADRFFPK